LTLIDALAAGENLARVRLLSQPKEGVMRFEESLRFGRLFKLSDEDRVALCHEIAEACEQSFRRGFQQGYEGAEPVTVDVLSWRFNTPLSESPSPHGLYDNDSISRHSHEVGLPSQVVQPEM
jgi:hypothetical protein